MSTDRLFQETRLSRLYSISILEQMRGHRYGYYMRFARAQSEIVVREDGWQELRVCRLVEKHESVGKRYIGCRLWQSSDHRDKCCLVVKDTRS